MRRAAALLVLALAGSGCSGSLLQSQAEAPKIYRLASPALATRGAALPMAVSVSLPRAAAALDTDRIAVVQAAGGFDYIAGVRWAEPAPQMLQQMLVEALVADGRFATVVAAPSRVPAEYLLDVELRRFAAVYAAAAGPPEVQVQWQVTLVDVRRGLRLASSLEEASALATANRRDAVIAAFQSATAAVVQQSASRIRAESAGLMH